MRYELPLTTPPKTSHLFYALPLSIILTKEDNWNWYYSEFVQLYGFKDSGDNIQILSYKFDENDIYEPLEALKHYSDSIKLGNEIIDLFCLYIRNQYYVYTLCDDYYITTMDVNYHRIHDTLFYGYDDEKEVFLAYAYNGGKLKKFFVPYKDFLRAYYAEEIKNDAYSTIFYRLRDKKYQEINLEKIKWHLLDYMECVNTRRRERPQFVWNNATAWGFDVYDMLKEMFFMKRAFASSISYANLFCFYEHKKGIKERFDVLEKKALLTCSKGVSDAYGELIEKAKIIINLAIKINIKQWKNCDREYGRILDLLQEMKEREFICLNDYVEENKEVLKKI